MNRTELVRELSDRTGLDAVDCSRVLDALAAVTRECAADGTRLPLADPGRARAGQPLIYGVRPEAMTLGGGIPLTVEVTEPTGSETHVVGHLGGTPITGVFRDRVAARPGEDLGVSIDAAAVHLFDAEGGARLSG